MAILSEMLQFPHHDCARGSTVERPFLQDLASALGYDGPRPRTKDDVLRACIELATGEADESLISKGETVTNDALEAIIQGVLRQGLQRVSLTDQAPAARIAVARAELEPEDDPFDPLDLSDERRVSLRAIKVRSGQGAFRQGVLRAYGGRCAVSACDVPEALEAAHITPYKGPNSNSTKNGICLRADLHRLWDTGRLAVHESTHEVLLDSAMIGTDYGLEFVGRQIRLPVDTKKHPSAQALEQQRLWAGL